jgi:rubrerythrin
MAALAKAAGQQQVAELMAQTLQEEKQTDEKLTQLAESELNPAAIGGGGGGEAEEAEAASGQRGGKRSPAR